MSEVTQIQPHQQRVINERRELGDKMDKLHTFTRGATFKTLSEAEQSRLHNQLSVMNVYEDILRQRIEALGIEVEVFEDGTDRDHQIKSTYQGEGKLAACKFMVQLSGCSLMQAKKYVEQMAAELRWSKSA